MPDYITTYTGKHFYPAEPDVKDVDILDVAHALPLLCRGNGHVKRFFSVGQHCINCAKEALERNYGPRIALACLIHDASEAYMSDVPRPFKKAIPHYVEAEDKLLRAIMEKFLGSSLLPEEEALVKEIDDIMLSFDLRVLLNEPAPDHSAEVHIPIRYDFVPFEIVENEYLALFHTLQSQL